MYRPSTKWRSLWQTPLATVRTTTSRSLGSSISTCSIVSGWPGPWKTAAFIWIAPFFSESVEHQDRARDLASFHRAEGVVDVFEFAALADHVVEVEAALQIEIDVLRHVDAEAVRAHVGALQFALGEKHVAVDFDLLADGDHADDGRGAAGLERVECLLGGFFETDRFERVIDAAAGHLSDFLDWIAARRIDGVGRAHPLGHRELALEHIDRDYFARARDSRTLDR